MNEAKHYFARKFNYAKDFKLLFNSCFGNAKQFMF